MTVSEENWDLESAETAYTVIAQYVEHTQISGIIIAMLASKVGEENLGFLVESEHWKNYMNSKRELEAAKTDIEKLTTLIMQRKQS